MGTLTGDTIPLSQHCPHKLPASCRLTALPICCACQDKRPHSRYYSTYVDGIGLVARGARWDRYCYFCALFWRNRVAATNPQILIEDTKIPEVPDQTPFVNVWFDYHRGYRIERDAATGEERRIVLTPEKPWRDVDPGTLPILNEHERRMVLRNVQAQRQTNTEEVSLENTFDELLAEVTASDEQETRSRAAAARLAADERDLESAARRLEDAERACTRAQLRSQRANAELEAAERELRECQTRRRAATRDHQARQYAFQMLHRRTELEDRARQRFARVFGTREDIERQGSEYQSPLATMFARAYDRYDIAEEVRAVERASNQNNERHETFLANLAETQYPSLFHAIREDLEREDQQATLRTLDDADDNRPEPKTEEQLMVKLMCKVCLTQIADTACLPCGHLVMCVYCADIVIPVRKGDQTAPVKKTGCPMCRKQVSKRVRIFTS